MLRFFFISALFCLAASSSSYSPSIPGIQINHVTLVSDHKNTPQSYSLQSATATPTTQLAMGLQVAQWNDISRWSLVEERKGGQLILVFTTVGKWQKIEVVVWLIDTLQITAGTATIKIDSNVQNNGNLAQFKVGPIKEEENQCVAVVFVNGVDLLSSNSSSQGASIMRLVPFRVYNQTVMLNIQGGTGMGGIVNLSYLVFAPMKTSFMAFGDSFSFNSTPQYNDISASAPPSPYLLFGLTSINSSLASFSAAVSPQSYLLTVSTSSPIWVGYIYLMPKDICANCFGKIVQRRECVAGCLDGSELVGQWCRPCRKELQEVYDNKTRKCVKQESIAGEIVQQSVSANATIISKDLALMFDNKQQVFIPLSVIQAHTLSSQSPSATTSVSAPQLETTPPSVPTTSTAATAFVPPTKSANANSTASPTPTSNSTPPTPPISSANQTATIQKVSAGGAQISNSTNGASPAAGNKATLQLQGNTTSGSSEVGLTLKEGNISNVSQQGGQPRAINITVTSAGPVPATQPIPSASQSIPPANQPTPALSPSPIANTSPTQPSPPTMATNSSSTPSNAPKVTQSSSPSVANTTIAGVQKTNVSVQNLTMGNGTLPAGTNQLTVSVQGNSTANNTASSLANNSASSLASNSSNGPSLFNTSKQTVGTDQVASTYGGTKVSSSPPGVTDELVPAASSPPTGTTNHTVEMTTNSTQNLKQNGLQNSSTVMKTTINTTTPINSTTNNTILQVNSSSQEQRGKVDGNITNTTNSSVSQVRAIVNSTAPKNSAPTLSPPSSAMQPLLVSSDITSNSTSQPTPSPCANQSNTVLVGTRCLCRVGYLSINDTCISLQLILLPASTTSPKAATACGSGLSYSTESQQCTCPQGYSSSKAPLSLNDCQPRCIAPSRYDPTSKTCTCNDGYTMIDNICKQCTLTGPYTNQQLCYPIALPTAVCRYGYNLNNQNYCLNCLKTSGCCSQGFSYNGSQCICLGGSVSNSTCIGVTCGDSIVQGGESCDDGNVVNGDGCSSTCRIEPGYYCTAGHKCSRSICGDGLISGGEQCDDNNTANGDGCSSFCLIQSNYTCIGEPSRCFPYPSGNLTLSVLSLNANNAYLQFLLPAAITLQAAQLASTFFAIRFLTGNPATPYCQQESPARFACLLIYPSGVPASSSFIRFSYNYRGAAGAAIVEVKETQWPVSSRRK